MVTVNERLVTVDQEASHRVVDRESGNGIWLKH